MTFRQMERLVLLGAISVLPLAHSLLAQESGPALAVVKDEDQVGSAPEWMKRLAIDPDSAEARAYAEQQKVRREIEKELRKIRARHFGTIRNVQIRQEGIVKLREFTQPAIFPSMIDLFKREKADVRTALLDHFEDSKTPEGDAALAWMAMFDREESVRADAARRVRRRTDETGKIPNAVKYAIYEGFRSDDEPTILAAGHLAANLDMHDAIPWLIARLITAQPVQQPQVQGAQFGGQDRNGALAWIFVGRQTAFVSDLTPVIAESAVAFDPQLSVVNEGVILRVVDAVVITYRVNIFNLLTDYTSRVWGKSTRDLGWNIPAWREWYTKEFLPEMKRREAERKAAEKAADEGIRPSLLPK
jgi:hypothetical protein